MADSASYKPEIFLRLFKKRWNEKTGELKDPVVFSDEIREEHAAYRRRRDQQVEVTNVPAFMKDFVRKRTRANANWPREILEAGYTARQVTGGGRIFEFIRLVEGQTEPFPSTAPMPSPDVSPHRLSSLNLSLASRRLGRADEPWLVQVSVRLHVVETYFALFSSRKASIRQVDHLQNALKLRRTEIDALFLGIAEPEPGKFEEFIITCEAKRVGEDIITEQVLAQVKAVFHLPNVTQASAIPIALKSISPSRIQVIEFAEVKRADIEVLEALIPVNQAVFELEPAVPGIGVKTAQGPITDLA